MVYIRSTVSQYFSNIYTYFILGFQAVVQFDNVGVVEFGHYRDLSPQTS